MGCFLGMNQGLVTEERENIDDDAKPFARKTKEIGRQGLKEGASLAEVVCLNTLIFIQFLLFFIL